MKKHTRFLALLLTAIMLLSLTACGGNNGDPPSGSDTPNTDTNTPGEPSSPGSEPAAPAGPSAAEPIKDLVLADTGELTTLFRPHAEGATEDHIIRNLVVNLLEFDNHDTVTIRVVESALVDDQLWETGEVDYTDVHESTLSTIMADPGNKWNDYLVESRLEPSATNMLFNYSKMKEDGTPDTNWNTAVANEAFRKSIYYGLDLTNIWYNTNPLNPLSLESLGFTCKDFVFFDNGDDYSSHVISQLGLPEGDGKSPRRYQPDKAQEYKQQAMQELSAKGVTFPVTIDYYIKAGVETAMDNATIVKEIFEALGTDYIVFNIKTYVSSYSQEVSTPALDCFSTSGWGADFLDVSNWLDQCLYQSEAALYSKSNMHLDGITDPELIEQFTTFTNMVYAAEKICDDLNARNQAFADAEAYMINHALVIPWSYRCYWTMTKINEYSKSYSGCGIGWQFKNRETSTEPYTAEQYAQFVTGYYG